MIFGIGCDLCAIARMQKILAKPTAAHFLQRVFAPQELAYFKITPSDAAFSTIGAKHVESMAANFAAKEAFLKATGMGLAGFALAEVAALRNERGAPYYAFTGGAADYMAQNALIAHLSLSHEKGAQGLAMAYCILEVRNTL